VIKHGTGNVMSIQKERKRFTSYSSFEAMQKDTAELLKQMKVM
jgi:hypothetical protein